MTSIGLKDAEFFDDWSKIPSISEEITTALSLSPEERIRLLRCGTQYENLGFVVWWFDSIMVFYDKQLDRIASVHLDGLAWTRCTSPPTGMLSGS